MEFLQQSELVSSLEEQMDAAANTVYLAFLAAVDFLWAGVTKQDPVKAFGLDIARRHALFCCEHRLSIIKCYRFDILLKDR